MIAWLSGIMGEIVTEETAMEIIAGITIVAMAAFGHWVLNRRLHRTRRWSKLDRDMTQARMEEKEYAERT